MAKALVTGASGFIGTHLVQGLIERGDEVACFVRRTSRLDRLPTDRVRLVYGDVCDRESVAKAVGGCDVVYHLAGLTKTLQAAKLEEVNGAGVDLLAAACAERQNPPTLVLVSSLAAAGPSSFERPRALGDQPAPVSQYGRSKRHGELAAEAWAREVPITIVRPPIVIGEGDGNGLPMFRIVLRRGVHFVPTFRPWRVSIVHAADLAAALILAADRGSRLATNGNHGAHAPQGYYFVDGDQQPTYVELGKLIGRVGGRAKVRIVRLPRAAVWIAAGTTDLISRLFGRANIFSLDKAREATAGSWTCSDRELRDSLGYSPALSLAERLRQTADWYRQQGWI